MEAALPRFLPEALVLCPCWPEALSCFKLVSVTVSTALPLSHHPAALGKQYLL